VTDDATTEATDGTARGWPRWMKIAVPVAVALLVAAVVWAVARPSNGAEPGAGASSPSASPSATGPGASPSPSASTEPSAAPTQGPDSTTAPGAGFDPSTEPGVGLDDPAAFDSGVTATLGKLEAVQGEAHGPGEVSGPAVRVTVVITNGTTKAITLDQTVVNVYGGAQAMPGEPLSGPGVAELAGSLGAGRSATGVYVFALPADQRNPLQVTVSYDPDDVTVLFQGPGPTG
jgi:hypothetical protein